MTALEILALALALFGIVGSIVPGLPGPPVSWVGALLAHLGSGEGPISLTVLLILLAATILVTVLDYIVPAGMTRTAGGHKAASTGAMIGLVAGIVFTPVGMILGSLLGAFIGELLVARSGGRTAFKASLGAFAGFLTGTLMKFVCAAVTAYLICLQVF